MELSYEQGQHVKKIFIKVYCIRIGYEGESDSL